MGKLEKITLESKSQLLIAAAVELVLAYILASRAVDTGSIWQYGLALILLIMSINALVRSFKTHGKK